MRLMTSMLDRVLTILTGLEGGGKRRRQEFLQRAVLETLESRLLMDGALQLFWVQTGNAEGRGLSTYPNPATVSVSHLSYEHHWVVANSAQDAAYILLNATGASATLLTTFTDSHYSPSSNPYNVGTAQTDFWIVGTAEEINAGQNSTVSSSTQLLQAYGGYLDTTALGGPTDRYQVYANIMALGDTNYCPPCNGFINPGVVNFTLDGVTATGQDSNLATILNTAVWGTGVSGGPDKTVAQVMNSSNEGLRILNADPSHAGTNSQYLVVFGAGFTEIFHGSGGAYTTTMAGSKDILVYDSSSQSFVVTDADGQRFTFGSSFDGSGVGSGIQGQTDAGGNTTSYSYSGGLASTITRPMGANGLQRTENTYVSGTARLATVVEKNSSNNGTTWTTVQQTAYTYYGAGDPGGPENYLAVLTVKDGTGQILEQSGYRYYTSDGSTGRTGMVKYTFGASSMARLTAAGLRLNTNYPNYASSDSDLQVYADSYYEYDSVGRVAKRRSQGEGCSGCAGGEGTYTYSYATSANSGSDLNNWTNKTVVNRIDETEGNKVYTTHTVYTNSQGQALLDVVQSDGQSWLNYNHYDADGHQTLHVNPSGMVSNGTLSYNESLADLVNFNATSGSFIVTNQGLFEWTDYYTASTATTTVVGAAAGYAKDTAVSQGQNGTKYYQSFTDYIKNTAGGRDYFQVADSVAFPQAVTSNPGTASTAARVTTYAYTWLQNGTTNTNQMASLTVTQPMVSAANNGPGTTSTADTTVAIFDSFGRTNWSKDADGFINYLEYDSVTGSVTKTITDVNTSQTSNFYGLPSGWASPSTASALNLITTYSADSLGRTTKVTDPNGNVSYTIYDDTHHAVFSLTGATLAVSGTNGTLTTTGPIMMSRDQLVYAYTQDEYYTYVGSYAESLTFSGTLTVKVDDAAKGIFEIPTGDWTSRGTTSDLALFNLIGNATSGSQFTLQSLSRSLISAGAQLVESDVYFNIDNSTYLNTNATSAYSGVAAPFAGSNTANFYATDFGYDELGRRAHLVSPTGTIRDTIYDGLGRPRATYIGTDDVPDYYVNGDWAIDWEDFTYGMANNLSEWVTGVNMTLVTENQYDGGAVGDGNLTSLTQYPGGGADSRTTAYLYDWRDRQIASKSGLTTNLPAGWSAADIGYPGVAGSATFDGGSFHLTAGGDDLGYDDGLLVSAGATGNATLVARVVSQSGTDDPQTGVMIRNSGDWYATYAAVLVTPEEGVTFMWRSAPWDLPNMVTVGGITSPVWVKLERSGGSFSAYYSTNGSSWTQIGSSQTISMNSNALVGLAASAHSNVWDDQATAVMDNVSLNGTAIVDGLHRPLTVNTLDNLGKVVTTSSYDGDAISMIDSDADGVPDTLSAGALRARTDYAYDEQSRAFKTTTYSVNAADGTFSTTSTNTLVSQTWFDKRGDRIASYSSGGAMSKSTFDGAGRLTVSYTTDGGAVNNTGTIRGTWADAHSVSNDIVLSQVEYTYDSNGQVLLTTDRQAFHDNATTSTGALLGPSDTTGHAARVSYLASYYDAAGRLTTSVNVGTNGGSVFARPANATSNTRSDTVLITSYTYTAGGQVETVTDPEGLVGKTSYDNLGRQTQTIANYQPGTNSGNPTDSANQTTLYTYDGSNHVLTLTAKMPSGQTDQTTAYVYNLANASSAGYVTGTTIYSNDLLWATQYPDKTTGTASTNAADIVLSTYDSLGEMLTKTDRNGVTHTYSYDVLGRITLDSVSQTLTVGNSGLETPALGSGNYAYNATGATWTFTGDAGITDHASSLNVGTGYSGNQVAFLQTNSTDTHGSMTQTFSVAIGGSFQFAFLAAQRNTANQHQIIAVNVDGHSVGTFNATSSTFATYTTDPFTIPAGNHTVSFTAIATGTANQMAFVDGLSLTAATAPSSATITVNDSSFQNQTVSTYLYNPTGSSWTFTHNAGLAAFGSSMAPTASGNSGTSQVAFLESNSSNGDGQNGLISESVNFPSGGLYHLSFTAWQRESAAAQRIIVSFDGTQVASIFPTYGSAMGYTSANFTVAQGDHMISFQAATDPATGNYAALVEDVRVVQEATPLALVSVLSMGTSYNSQGLPDQLTSYSSSTGGSGAIVNQIQNVYNGFGQLTRQYQEHAGAVNTGTSNTSLSMQYAYSDAAHGVRLVSMTYPSGQVLYYNYSITGSLNDVISRLDNLVSSDTHGGTVTLESYKYLGFSTVVERDHPQDGVNLTYIGSGTGDAGDKYMGLDRFGRVVDQKWVDANNGNAVVDEYQYAFDRDSNVVSKINVNATSNNETYTYDDLNRLTDMTRNGTANSYQSFSLDALSNIDTITNGTNGSTSGTFNSQNQLTGFGGSTLAYDNNGNTTTDEQGHVQVYDAWNRLLAVNGTDGRALAMYAYDGGGRRITEGAPNLNPRQVYFSGQQVVEEDTTASGLRLAARYYWSPVYQNALILRDTDFGGHSLGSYCQRVYALQDANYNVTALVTNFTMIGDATHDKRCNSLDFQTFMGHWSLHTSGGDTAGDFNHDGMVDAMDYNLLMANYNQATSNNQWLVTERLVYNAYGSFTATVRDEAGAWQNWGDYLGWNITFQGGRWNALTRQVQFGVRQVDVDTGRWTSWDPTDYPNGLNPYAVDAANPINRVDPKGTITVRTLDSTVGNSGMFTVKWNFILDNPAPAGGGYIVQKVTSSRTYKKVKPAQTGQGFGDGVNPVVYWEAWYVQAGHRWPNAMFAPLMDYTTDRAFLTPTNGFSGTQSQEGEIRFYTTCGILGNHIKYPNNASDFEPGKLTGFNFNQSYHRISPGILPSTGTEPDWWRTNPAGDNHEAPASRSVSIEWNSDPDSWGGGKNPIPKPVPIIDPPKYTPDSHYYFVGEDVAE